MECKIHSGAPQGSVLSPLSFLVYINDITELPITKGTVLKLFADDILVYGPIHIYYYGLCPFSASLALNVGIPKPCKKLSECQFDYLVHSH